MLSQFWTDTEGMASTLWYPLRYNLNDNLEAIAPTSDFALVYMAMFSQASLEQGLCGAELSALPTGQPVNYYD